ncbi:MAG: lysophospholipase [Candidatus Omnitrophota bacterium]|jgi:lysophospholipase
MKTKCKLISFDKTVLQYCVYQGSQKGVPVLLIHGASEHGGRYEDFAHFLNTQGYDVIVPDLRGYGSSGGATAFIESFDDFSRDIEVLMNAAEKRFGYNKPFVLLGHSMGGLIALHAALSIDQSRFTGLCLSSPCLGLVFKIPSHLKLAAIILSTLAPKHLFKTESMPEILTHAKDQIKIRAEDELIKPFMSARLFCEMQKTMQSTLSRAEQLKLPLAIFQAGDDRVVNAGLSKQFFESITNNDKFYKEYPDLYHEILHEEGREAIWQEMSEWLQGHVSQK